jgi:RNA polymerase sigma-70 factor (ECF subfamily)
MISKTAKLDDTALVQMALAGHGECFGELLLRHKNMVRARVVSVVRNSPDVDDVVQEVFFKAWRALPTFRANATVCTWLTSIATNEALMLHRRERRQRLYATGSDVDTLASRAEPADVAVMRGEEARAIHEAIVNLPVKYRDVVVLRDIEELSALSTANRLKSTVPGVKTRLFRARLKLKAALRGLRPQTLFHAA